VTQEKALHKHYLERLPLYSLSVYTCYADYIHGLSLQKYYYSRKIMFSGTLQQNNRTEEKYQNVQQTQINF